MRRTVLLIGLLVAVVHVCLAQDAPERRLTILNEERLRGNRWPHGYAHAGGGTELTEPGGRIPIVEWAGRRAVKMGVNHAAGGNFVFGIAAPRWSHMVVDDFGRDGTLEFDIAGELNCAMTIGLHDGDADGDGPDGETVGTVPLRDYVQVGQNWRPVTIPLGRFMDAAPGLDLGDLLKVTFSGVNGQGTTTLYVTNIVFRTTEPERVYPPVKVDQVGYATAWRKVAKVTPAEPFPGEQFFVVRHTETGETAFTGRLTVAALNDEPSGDNVYDADFSALRTPGTYVVEVAGVGESAPFAVAGDVYDRLFYDVFRFMFFQRCGMELKPEYAGPYAHPLCHGFDREIRSPLGDVRDCSGGRHDAGDMNRYTPWTVPYIYDPLALYEHYPEAFTDGQFNLPESGNGLPDILDEVKYEVVWLRKMLIRGGPHAGEVYDRVHEHLARQPEGVGFYDLRHGLAPPTDAAACALVAGLAHAYVVYSKFPTEEQFADECLADALLAWDYLTTRGNPQPAQMFTAAVMLFEATGRPDVHDVVKHLANEVLGIWEGQMIYDVQAYDCGLAEYALSARPEVDRALQARVRSHYKQYADKIVAAARARGYNSPMPQGVVYVWGSCGLIAKAGKMLMIANRFSPDPAYVETARETLHWLLGRNPVNSSMITGYGTPPLGPIYHSMYGPLGPGLPMPPGYLCGGPTRDYAPGVSVYPAKCWRPYYTSFEMTECGVRFQVPLIYLLGALQAEPD